ncbi:hypothetical protein B0H14DRAFT_3494216 [Mycena olivaceomarginata]|nr:hypothetical protein B0H14DRAFT_3494216 [Mycena olivaceomarginata]
MANKDPTEPHNTSGQLLSGNGWKSTVWPDVVKVIHAANPDANPPKDLISKLEDLKKTFELYLFVEKFSSSGWDEDEKHASNTPEYIEDFIKAGTRQEELDELYDGFQNRATGEHVVHFRKPCKCITKENTAAISDPSTWPAIVTPDAPMLVLDNTQPDREATGGLNNYDDELRLVCVLFIELHTGLPMFLQSPLRLPTKRTRAESDDDDATEPKPKRPHVKSNSSTGSNTAKRNAQVGSQIALSFNKLSHTMAKPIVTTMDVSYVDDMMRVLEDENLLPPNPYGKLFNIVSAYLTESPVRGPSLSAGVVLPEDY